MITTALETLKLIILLLIIIYAILAACGAARRKDIASTIVRYTLWITCVIGLR
nr:MAG TPA: chitin synthase regulator [Caudoviricetes sp.]